MLDDGLSFFDRLELGAGEDRLVLAALASIRAGFWLSTGDRLLLPRRLAEDDDGRLDDSWLLVEGRLDDCVKMPGGRLVVAVVAVDDVEEAEGVEPLYRCNRLPFKGMLHETVTAAVIQRGMDSSQLWQGLRHG